MNENEGKPVVIRARAVVLDSLTARFAGAKPGDIAVMLRDGGPTVLTPEEFAEGGWEWSEEPRPKRSKVSTQKYETATLELVGRVGHVTGESLARETGSTDTKAAAWLGAHGPRMGLVGNNIGVWIPRSEVQAADPQPEAKA